MIKLIDYIEEYEIKLIISIIVIIVLIIIAINMNEEKADKAASPQSVDSWSINAVDESTNDPFAEQYQIDFFEEDLMEE